MAVYTEIDNPREYFNTVLWTGGNADQSVTGVGFTSDWIWLKERSHSDYHFSIDSVRGKGSNNHYYNLSQNATGAESDQTSGINTIGSDGFSITNRGEMTESGHTYVAWCWKAGGTASSNSDGGTTSSVSANTTAGFSIVSWQGSSSSSNQTMGHGLGVTPSFIVSKNRGSGNDLTAWVTYHKNTDSSAPQNYTIYLNNQDARVDNSVFGDTAPTTSVYTVNTSTDNMPFISYCFAQKQGFSHFAKYRGASSTDGAFVYCGFRPAFFMARAIGRSESWYIFDDKRVGYNVDNNQLYADADSAEATTDYIDFTATGVKFRYNSIGLNGASEEYIFMAFANAPIVNSKGVPNNAV